MNEGGKFVTDLYVKPTDTHQYLHAGSCHVCHSKKPTDTHQYLHAGSCHVYHSKKSIPYNHALNRICSNNQLFDKRCNELEGWLVDISPGTKRY